MASYNDYVPGFSSRSRLPRQGKAKRTGGVSKPVRRGGGVSDYATMYGGEAQPSRARQYGAGTIGAAGLVAGAGGASGGTGTGFFESEFGRQIGRPVDTSRPPRSLRATPASQAGPVVDPTQYNKTLQDFLAQAREMLAAQRSGMDQQFAAQESSLRSNASAAAQGINKGYGALSTFIQGNDPKLQSIFQGAVGDINQGVQQTTNTIQQANQAAQAQQQAILARLGIEDANIPIANTGQSMEQDMSRAVADVAQRGQLSGNELTSNMATERAYNTSAGTAAGLEGQAQQDRVQRDLVSRLAELSGQRAEAQSGSETDAYSLAMDLMNQDYSQFQGNYDRRYTAQRDAMGMAQDMAELEARQAERSNQSPAMNNTAYRALGPIGQASYALQQSGVEPGQAAIITRAIEQAAQQGGIRDVNSFIRLVQETAGSNPQNRIPAANAAAIYFQYFG